jgi:hypothetical protein
MGSGLVKGGYKLIPNKILKKKVLREIEKLREDHLVEVRDFVDHLLKMRRRTKEAKLDPEKDPILKLIGIADVEPFSHIIDSELYGD